MIAFVAADITRTHKAALVHRRAGYSVATVFRGSRKVQYAKAKAQGVEKIYDLDDAETVRVYPLLRGV